MTTSCARLAPDAIDLYFYDELAPAERAAVEAHLTGCLACRGLLNDLRVIADALDGRPVVEAPPGADWSGLMGRLHAALGAEGRAVPSPRAATVSAARVITWLAAAAILSLATTSIALRDRWAAAAASSRAATLSSMSSGPAGSGALLPAPTATRPAIAPSGLDDARPTPNAAVTAAPVSAADPAFAALSEQHFERSKLVVLGLASKDPRASAGADWHYERELASTLLADTRLYRRAAQDRGLTQLAGVMSDLELVLLQTSLSDDHDTQTLPQIQRLIRKRDLVTKMEVVSESYH